MKWQKSIKLYISGAMDLILKQELAELKKANLLRSPKGEWGKGWINFTSNDYLGLRNHPQIIEAAIGATKKYGAGSGASRYAGGNHPLHDKFEENIAKYKGYEAACVFGSGYLANIGVIQALAAAGDEVLADKLCHASIIDGVRLSGAKLLRFKHNDVSDAKKRITPKTKFIITEEIFSMDGDISPKIDLVIPTIIDGAHSLYKPNTKPQSPIYIGTMSKALGSYGGYICGSKTFIEYIKSTARSQIYSTALPPSVLAAAITALDVIKKEKPYEKCLENAKLLGADSAIIPIILGSEDAALKAEKKLKEQKILVSAMRPPTVPANTSRLRITVTAAHKKEEIEKLANALKKII